MRRWSAAGRCRRRQLGERELRSGPVRTGPRAARTRAPRRRRQARAIPSTCRRSSHSVGSRIPGAVSRQHQRTHDAHRTAPQGHRRHRRLRQHRHRPDGQAPALRLRRAALDGRHRPGQSTASRGRASAGLQTTADGVDWLLDARTRVPTSSSRRPQRAVHARATRRATPRPASAAVDLTPAALGPVVVPAVNLDAHLDAPNVNMVTCGGQATMPIVAAVSRVAASPTPRSSRRSRRARPARARARTSTSSPRRPPRRRATSAAPSAARRSSSSTRPSRRS